MKYFLILINIFFIGCKSCNNKIYNVNTLGYINIVFTDCKVKGSFLVRYIDSVRNNGLIFEDTLRYHFFGNSMPSETERIVHFNEEPEEWYVLSFDARQPWVEYLYNYKINPDDMIREKNKLSANDIQRVIQRVQLEIINEAEKYANEKNIPDSIVYFK